MSTIGSSNCHKLLAVLWGTALFKKLLLESAKILFFFNPELELA
jgi:hypothetical protein